MYIQPEKRNSARMLCGNEVDGGCLRLLRPRQEMRRATALRTSGSRRLVRPFRRSPPEIAESVWSEPAAHSGDRATGDGAPDTGLST